jgi:hypothetical protein
VDSAGVDLSSPPRYTHADSTQMLRAENFEAPSSAQAAAGITYRPSCHASNGPINIQFDPSV